MRRLSYEIVSQLVRYEPETGFLFWLPRDRVFFRTQNQFTTWNKRYSGKRALATQNPIFGYLQGHLLGTYPKAHQIAWLLFHKQWQTNFIDHIDGDRTNNKISNLRDVSRCGNARNRARNSAKTVSGVTGVYAHGKKWAAKIYTGGKLVTIGAFDTIEEAAAARFQRQIELGFSETHGLRDSPFRRRYPESLFAGEPPALQSAVIVRGATLHAAE